MKRRANKRRIYARYRLRGKTIWLTAEERAWLDTVPIGREFGGKDYERLEILDAFTQGRIDVQKAMLLLGIDQDALAAMVEKEGLPRQFVIDIMQSQAQAAAGMLTPYVFSDDDISPDSPEVLKRLHARFPYMFEGENIGIYISRGWMLMFAKLCEDIDALLGADKQGFHWIQIKEKFGSARFYWSMEGGRQAVRVDEIDKLGTVTTLVERHVEDGSNPTLQEQISALVDAASDKTQHMCIVCGQPGKGHSDRDYVLILCDEHIRQREAGIEPVF